MSSGATFNNESGASLELTGNVTINKNGGAPSGGTVVNAGTLSKTGGTGVSEITATLNNTGIIQADSGTLNIAGTFSNFSLTTNTLTGGTYDVSAILQFFDANINTNAAAITLTGSAAEIVDQRGDNALSNLAANTTAGSFTIQRGSNLTTSGAFGNAGITTVGTASTLTVSGAYTQSSGSTNLSSGTLTSTNSTVTFNGGILEGSGTVNGNVTSGGQIVPGGAAGTGVLSIAGAYTQSSVASLTVNLGGLSPGTGYSQLDVSGLATLDGSLYVNLIDGFAPGNNDTFQVLNYNPHRGEIANITLENFPDGTTLAADYTASDLVLTANVTPATVSTVSVSWGTVGSASLQTAADGVRLLPSGRNVDLPWLGVNKINITLSQSASLTSGDVVVISAGGFDYGPVTLSASGTNYVITLARPINAADRVTFTIGSPTIATYTRRLDVLPGDVNDDGVVTMQDAVAVRNEYLGFAPVTIPLLFLDVNGDGGVDVNDYNTVRRFIGAQLPSVF
jgi:trimeric autotransporter adhesin